MRLLERLRELPVETHLIATPLGARDDRARDRLGRSRDVKELADVCYGESDQAAAVSSGSFLTDGMVIAPVQHEDAVRNRDRLLAQPRLPRRRRGAEGTTPPGARRPRDAAQQHPPPEHAHALRARRDDPAAGPRLLPPSRGLDEIVDHTVLRILDQFGLGLESDARWTGLPAAPEPGPEAPDGVMPQASGLSRSEQA